jgi:cytosine/adenosine deaminase-related metal-dependent hydrolase
MVRIRAGSVHPVTAPPISDGAVLVDDAGRIAAVGPHAAVPAPAAARPCDFRDAVLVPGLVNCHTHLELTDFGGKNTERGFPAWIRRMRELKDATPPEDFRRSAERGVRDCWARGVTCMADTGSTGAVAEALHTLGGRGIVYQEVFGPDPAKCAQSIDDLDRAVRRLRSFATAQLELGASPHAPYTVSEPLYRAVAAFARREHLPVAVHLAESPEETLLVRDGAGPFADGLRARGIPVAPHGCSPVQYLLRLGVLASGNCLAIHCVQVDGPDVDMLRDAGAAVAHCPRSNRAHGHGMTPLAALRAAGVRVGLGTDSVASVADLDLWAVAEAAGLAGEEALRMLTIEGARALRWEREIGSLDVGKSADLAVFAVAAHDRPLPPVAALLTVVAGRIVHGPEADSPGPH